MSLSSIPRKQRDRVFLRDKGRCRYCQLSQVGQAAVFHINHVVPRSKGGLTEDSNLVLQCPHCSLHKSNKTVEEDPATGQTVNLFHPLELAWSEHFSLAASGTCSGLTPIGRATVEALRMNDPIATVARALQIKVGLLSL